MTPPATAPEPPLAPVERRFNALLVDRLVAWGLLGAAGYVAWLLWWRDGAVWPGVGLIAVVAALVWLLSSALLAATGSSLGRALTGLRVVDVATGQPLGFARALRRSAVLGVAGLPTGGLGLAVLAWTAIEDPEALRRGWHDRVAGSLVIDRHRPTCPPETPPEVEAPRELVNLTALRLAPVEPPLQPVPLVAPVAPRPSPGADPTVNTSSPSTPGTVVPGPAPGRRLWWRLTADTGESVLLEGLLLLGRNPEGRPGEQVHGLLPLASADMSLSKTHLQVHLAADGTPVVVDRGSTNGSFLLRQGVSRDLTTGRPVTLVHGDRIRLGDRELKVSKED